jgi:hypothetical protein
MTSYFNSSVDFGFRPIRPEAAAQQADGYCEEAMMDFSQPAMDSCPPPPACFGWEPSRGDARSGSSPAPDIESDEELFTSDSESLPDASGFGLRAREQQHQQQQAAAAAKACEPSQPGPFHGSTLRELCAQYGEMAGTSATPCGVWADVLDTLREREHKTQWVLDPATARHMKYRTTLIEWILEVCADFDFGPTTADLAVQYMVSSRFCVVVFPGTLCASRVLPACVRVRVATRS